MGQQPPLHPVAYIVLGLVLLSSVLLFDLLQPLGVAAGVPYAALVMLGLLLQSRVFILAMAVAGTALTLYGFYSQTSYVDAQIVSTNRALAIFLIWTAAVISLRQLDHQKRLLELEDAHNRDTLTGIKNRKAIFGLVDEQVKHARKENNSLGLAVFDIDGFKNVNDCFGHLAGDAVLQQLAKILDSEEGFSAGRLGGEEFILLMPDQGLTSSAKRCTEVIDTIRNLSFSWQGQPVGLSLSAGVACLDDTMRNGFDLIRTADEALLRAKRKGGNRVALAEQSVLPD